MAGNRQVRTTWAIARYCASRAVTLLIDTDEFDSARVGSIIGDLIRCLR
ncbi:hypothetical protein [Sphaerisporangium fuscum]|nr:hypothetical protein [Sphaerisporangium fuscum]